MDSAASRRREIAAKFFLEIAVRLAKLCGMSAVEVISEIKKLPQVQRRKVYQFVSDQIRREEDRQDNETANRALAEPGENIPWTEARKRLSWA